MSQVCFAYYQLHINTHENVRIFLMTYMYTCLYVFMPVNSLSQNLHIVSTAHLWKKRYRIQFVRKKIYGAILQVILP